MVALETASLPDGRGRLSGLDSRSGAASVPPGLAGRLSTPLPERRRSMTLRTVGSAPGLRPVGRPLRLDRSRPTTPRRPAKPPARPRLHERGPRPRPALPRRDGRALGPRRGARATAPRTGRASAPARTGRRSRARARSTGDARPSASATACARWRPRRTSCALQIAERAEEAGRRLTRGRRASSGAGSAATLRARLVALERRMRQMEDDLAERARRAGALPGWLR